MIDGNSYLSDIFEKAFGIKSPVFLPERINLDQVIFKDKDPYKLPDPQKQVDLSFKNVGLKNGSKAEALSWMGTPIINLTIFEGGRYPIMPIENPQTAFLRIERFILPYTTLVDISRSKIITRTPMLGSGGTVKEMYGFDDWKIRIRGICLDDTARKTAKTASEQKEQLLLFERACSPIMVYGNVYNDANIHCIVINNLDFKHLEGKPNIIPFEMECESNNDYIINGF